MNIFFVTVLHKLGNRRRCWGWYEKFEGAEKAVLENHTDIFEVGYYDLAVIEEYPEGVMSLPEKLWWYKATYPEGSTPEERLKIYPTVIKLAATPSQFLGIIGLALG